MSALQDLVSAYQALLIAQYRTKPKAAAEIGIYARTILGDGVFFTALQNAFDLATAVGPQLDILGKYIGLSRLIGPPTPAPWFGCPSYNGGDPQNDNGCQNYLDTSQNVGILFFSYTYAGMQNTALSDEAYQFMLQLKAILNINDGTLSTIKALLKLFFGPAVTVVDNADMTLTYSIARNCPVDIATLTPFLPKPMGVGLIVNSTAALFTRVTSDGSTRVTSDGSTRIGYND